MIDAIEQNLLREVADLDSLPVGAYNIRANGQLAGRNTTANIDIVTKDDKPGIDIYIRPFTKNESVHIPVILTQTGLDRSGLQRLPHRRGRGRDHRRRLRHPQLRRRQTSQHDGIHSFYRRPRTPSVRYVEKHYGEGDGRGKQRHEPYRPSCTWPRVR